MLASPLRRARETAESVAVELSVPARILEVELHDDLAADMGLPLDLVRELAAGSADALLVGHQPAVEDAGARRSPTRRGCRSPAGFAPRSS